MADDNPAPEVAKRRYFTIQAVRIAGIACLLGAIYLRQAESADLLGLPLVLVVLGALLMVGAPRVLARRWRSGPR